MCWIHEKVKNK